MKKNVVLGWLLTLYLISGHYYNTDRDVELSNGVLVFKDTRLPVPECDKDGRPLVAACKT